MYYLLSRTSDLARLRELLDDLVEFEDLELDLELEFERLELLDSLELELFDDDWLLDLV